MADYEKTNYKRNVQTESTFRGPFLGPNTAAELGTVIVNYFLNWDIKYYPGTKSNVQSEM